MSNKVDFLLGHATERLGEKVPNILSVRRGMGDN